MARDLSIDLEVKPTLDAQATKNLIYSLEKELRKTHSGTHLPLAQKISGVYDKLIESGLATTPTSARIAFTKLAGGNFTARQQGILRLAEGTTARRGMLSNQYGFLQQQIARFREMPTVEGRASILRNISSIEKLVASINKSQKNLPYALKQVTQNVTGIKKEVSDWDFGTQKESSGSNAFLSFAKKLTGIATVASGIAMLVRKGGQAVINALNRGEHAMRLRAAYGNEINWGDIRARAGIYNMSLESVAAPSQYASDFNQRMMWGELSEREIIGLSRAGRWGRMVMSGEAARNPQAANQAFEELVTGTNPAKMRSILRQLGLPQDLMQYNIQGYDKTTREEYFSKFGEIAEKEWQAAVMMYDAGNQYQAATEQISAVFANVAGTNVATLSPQGKAVARKLGVGVVDNPVAGFNIFRATPEQIKAGVWGQNTVTQTVNNNVTINGNVDMDNIDSITEKMSAELAKSNYDSMANAIGARTSF